MRRLVRDKALRTIRYGAAWAIISGARPEHDHTGALFKMAREMGLDQPEPLVGRWEGETEVSWLFRGVTLEDARRLAQAADQDAFIYKGITTPTVTLRFRDGTMAPATRIRFGEEASDQDYTETYFGGRVTFHF